MFWPFRSGTVSPMLMQIDVKELDPPTGTVRIEGEENRSFIGWLGLIHTLEELIGRPAKK
jgi:hypothetical protein